MQNRDFARQFYANLPPDRSSGGTFEIQNSLTEIFDPLVPVVSHQLQSLQIRPGISDEHLEDCSELGWSLAPPPIRQVS